MENTRPILYGVADYAQIRKKNGWFIDRMHVYLFYTANHNNYFQSKGEPK